MQLSVWVPNHTSTPISTSAQNPKNFQWKGGGSAPVVLAFEGAAATKRAQGRATKGAGSVRVISSKLPREWWFKAKPSPKSFGPQYATTLSDPVASERSRCGHVRVLPGDHGHGHQQVQGRPQPAPRLRVSGTWWFCGNTNTPWLFCCFPGASRVFLKTFQTSTFRWVAFGGTPGWLTKHRSRHLHGMWAMQTCHR